MKLSYILAFGLGYALGHPTGRERARQVPGQLRELANRPQVREQVQGLKEKGTELAGRVTSSSSDSPDSTDGPDGTGRGRRGLMTRARRRPGGIEATTTPVSSGDPVTDARSATLTEPELAPETEAAALGTLPPKAPRAR